MPVYRATIKGAKSFLVRAESAAKAKDKIVSLDLLTSDEMADALEAEEKIHKADDSIVLEAVSAPLPDRINIETGMVERHVGDLGGDSRWEPMREATVEELSGDDPGSKWRTDPKSGLIQRQPQGADSEHWEDIRAATSDEVAAAKKK